MENNKIITTKQPKYPRINQTEEQKKAYYRKYYQQHKEKYIESSQKRKDEYYDCEVCKCSVKKQNIADHKRTQKHIRYLLIVNA